MNYLTVRSTQTFGCATDPCGIPLVVRQIAIGVVPVVNGGRRRSFIGLTPRSRRDVVERLVIDRCRIVKSFDCRSVWSRVSRSTRRHGWSRRWSRHSAIEVRRRFVVATIDLPINTPIKLSCAPITPPSVGRNSGQKHLAKWRKCDNRKDLQCLL
jgi:hypothetical protein